MKRLFILFILAVITLNGCNVSNGNDVIQSNSEIEKDITLYFADPQALYVVPAERVILVKHDINRSEFIKVVLEELIKGPRDDTMYPTIPSDVKVLRVEIEGSILYVDFSGEMHSSHWGGAAGENMTLLSLVNTLTEIDGIDGVMPSVEGSFLNIEHVIVDTPIIRDEENSIKN